MEILYPDSFLKNQNWTYLWINSLNFNAACFNYMPSWGLSKYIEIKLLTTCCYFMFLKKKKMRSGTSLLAWFSVWLLMRNISLVIFYYLTKFHCLVAFTLWDIAHYLYCNCFLTRLYCHKVWNQHYLYNQVFFLHGQKVNTKI